MDAGETRGEDMYEEILWDVYKQWLDEFDHEAAFRRNLPRRERESRFRSSLSALRGRARGPLQQGADARQCAR
jgi:hypothetical protein